MKKEASALGSQIRGCKLPLCRKLDPPIAPGTKINVVVRSDSNAAAYAFSQWLQTAGNRTWLLGVNKTLPVFPGAKTVTGGSNLTAYIKSTPFSIGCAPREPYTNRTCVSCMPIILTLKDSRLACRMSGVQVLGGQWQPLPAGQAGIWLLWGAAAERVMQRLVYTCRYSDAYAGKKAKLADAAVRNRAGKFLRYSKADWGFAGADIVAPPSSADWSKFNLTNLGGDKTYPIVTTTLIFTNSDLTGRGKCRLWRSQMWLARASVW